MVPRSPTTSNATPARTEPTERSVVRRSALAVALAWLMVASVATSAAAVPADSGPGAAVPDAPAARDAAAGSAHGITTGSAPDATAGSGPETRGRAGAAQSGGDTTRDTTVLWRGFRHAWSYNHRLNRLGSWIDPGECDGEYCTYEVGHAAASGTGRDRAVVRDAYTELSAEGVGFESGTVSIDLEGVEKTPDNGGGHDEALWGSREVRVELGEGWESYDEFGVVLNGFDLASEGEAAKPVEFRAGVTEARRVGDEVVFSVEYYLILDCDSFECLGRLNHPEAGLIGGKKVQDVDYRFDVRYLLVGGTSRSLDVTRGADVGNGYGWDNCRNNKVENPFNDEPENDKWSGNVFPLNRMFCEGSTGRELDHDRFRRSATIRPGGGGSYSVGTVGIAGLSLELDREAHFAQFDAVVGGTYRGSRYDATALPFFKEWASRPGLYSDAKFSYGFEGHAELDLSPVLIRIENGCKRSFVNAGGKYWGGDDARADGEEAVVKQDYAFGFGDQWRGYAGRGNRCQYDRPKTVRYGSASAPDPAFWVPGDGATVWEEFRSTERAEDPTRLRGRASDRYYSFEQPNRPERPADDGDGDGNGDDDLFLPPWLDPGPEFPPDGWDLPTEPPVEPPTDPPLAGVGCDFEPRRIHGSLSGAGAERTHSLSLPADCAVEVSLSGPDEADFDLYLTLDGRPPTTADFDRRSWGPDARESIALDGAPATLGVLVASYVGGGNYTVVVEPASESS